jgi:hypothetical protein
VPAAEKARAAERLNRLFFTAPTGLVLNPYVSLFCGRSEKKFTPNLVGFQSRARKPK